MFSAQLRRADTMKQTACRRSAQAESGTPSSWVASGRLASARPPTHLPVRANPLPTLPPSISRQGFVAGPLSIALGAGVFLLVWLDMWERLFVSMSPVSAGANWRFNSRSDGICQ